MIMMIIVATVVMSGSTALAAQPDFLSMKDIKGFKYYANTFLSAADSESIEDENAYSSIDADAKTSINGNALGSYNNIDNIPADADTTRTGISMNQTQSIMAVAVEPTTNMLSFSTLTITDTTSEVRPSIASGSLQKVGNIDNNAIETTNESHSGPYFDKSASKNVTALLGKPAYLNCRVKNLGNKTTLHQVSWVRHRDVHLLTVGRYTYTTDQRFRALHQPQTDDWVLQIKYTQHHDTGIYECQVATRPHMSHYIHLSVIEPSTEILGAPDLYLESGSTINLTCVILNSPEPPAYIFWNHNNAIINYDSPRGGISVVTIKGKTTTSLLLIKLARPSDSGIYQCNPSNAKPKSVTVHVLNGEFPAAMQRARQAHHRMSPSQYLLVSLSLYLSILAYVGHYLKPLPKLPKMIALQQQSIT